MKKMIVKFIFTTEAKKLLVEWESQKIIFLLNRKKKFSNENMEDLGVIEDLIKMKEQVKEEWLNENLCSQGSHHDAKEHFGPITITLTV